MAKDEKAHHENDKTAHHAEDKAHHEKEEEPDLTGLIPMQKTNAAGQVEVLPINPACVAACQAAGWSVVQEVK